MTVGNDTAGKVKRERLECQSCARLDYPTALSDFKEWKMIACHHLNYIMGNDGLNKYAKMLINRKVNRYLGKPRKKMHLTSIGRMLQKGIECENESIALFNQVFNKNLVKNTIQKNNGYIKGICDLIDDDTIIDIKTAWSNQSTQGSYKWQLHGYMWLYDKPKACTVTVFVDTPKHLLIDEDPALHIVNKPLHERIIIGNFVERDDEIIERIKQKSIQLKAYYDELLRSKKMAKDYSLHALNGHIHDQIDRIMNIDLSDEELKREIARGQALCALSKQSVEIADIFTKAADVFGAKQTPKMLGLDNG